MKKLITLVLTLVMLLGVAACAVTPTVPEQNELPPPAETAATSLDEVPERVLLIANYDIEILSSLYETDDGYIILEGVIKSLTRVSATEVDEGRIEMWKLEYRLLPEMPSEVALNEAVTMDGDWITEWRDGAQPLIVVINYSADDYWVGLGAYNTRTIAEEYGGDYDAAAVARYDKVLIAQNEPPIPDEARAGQPTPDFVYHEEDYSFDTWLFISPTERYRDYPDLGALLGFEPARLGEGGHEGFYLEFDFADANGLYADADALLEAAKIELYNARFISFFTLALDGDTLRATFMANPQPGAVEALGYDGPKFNTEYLDWAAETFVDVPDLGAVFNEPQTGFLIRVAEKRLELYYAVWFNRVVDYDASYLITMERQGFEEFGGEYIGGDIRSLIGYTLQDNGLATVTAVWDDLR